MTYQPEPEEEHEREREIRQAHQQEMFNAIIIKCVVQLDLIQVSVLCFA
jgi:hypothetical protein